MCLIMDEICFGKLMYLNCRKELSHFVLIFTSDSCKIFTNHRSSSNRLSIIVSLTLIFFQYRSICYTFHIDILVILPNTNKISLQLYLLETTTIFCYSQISVHCYIRYSVNVRVFNGFNNKCSL